MRITAVTSDTYRWPCPPIRNGRHTYTTAGLDVIRIQTDAGVSGLGLGAGAALSPAVVDLLAPHLLGADPFDGERLWHAMWQPKLVGRRGLTTRTISAIDIALWDLKGRALGLPLYKLLGGYRRAVPVYIAGGYYMEGKGLRELAQEMEQNVALGARAIKMKIGGASLAEDAERVRVVRETIGPDIQLMVDANCAYRTFEAINLARRIERYDIYWFEEPVAPDDYRGHRQVAQATAIPIATGENEYTRYGFRDLIEHEAAAILNADAQILGGITEFMKVAALAQCYDLPIAPHGSQEVHVHLVCAIANGLIVEYYRDTVDPLWQDKFTESLRLNAAGELEPPERPGLGIELNEEALAPYRLA